MTDLRADIEMGTNVMNSSSIPLVRIGMPVYNGEAYLERAIESLLNQTESNFELVISDNGSSDQTEAICRRFQALDERVLYFRQTKNRGAWWNFRFVLEQATSPYFMWAAHDDHWSSDWLKGLLAMFDDQTSMVYGSVQGVNENGQILGVIPDFNLDGARLRRSADYFLIEEATGKANLIYGLFRTELVHQCEIDGNVKGVDGEDMHLVYQMLAFGPFKHTSEVSMQKFVPTIDGGRRIAQLFSPKVLVARTKYFLEYIRLSRGLSLKLTITLLMPIKLAKSFLLRTGKMLTR